MIMHSLKIINFFLEVSKDIGKYQEDMSPMMFTARNSPRTKKALDF